MKKFEVVVEQAGKRDTLQVQCSSIIAALEKAHKTMQIEYNADSNAYKIVSACQVYGDGSSGDMSGTVIRSDYPIPGGPNPDMWEITGKIKPIKS